MTENAPVFIALIAILLMGAVAIVGMSSPTGQTITTTTNPSSRLCLCVIAQYDFQGNPINIQEQTVRVRSRQAHTDPGCDNRCDIMFGKSKRGRKSVHGFAI